MKVRLFLALAVASAAPLAGCGGPKFLSTSLNWNPGDDMNDLHVVQGEVHNGWGWGTTQVTGPDMTNQVVDAFQGQQIQVMPLTDSRTNKDIGSNVQKDTPRPVTTQDNVADFVTAHVIEILKACRLPVVSAGGTRILKGDITDYFVKEGDRYNGVVAMQMTLSDAAGHSLWQGIVRGQQDKNGRSFDAQNYNENLSDATVRAVHQLLMDPAFLAAAHKK